MKLSFTLVKQDFLRLETYVRSILAIAFGGAMGALADLLSDWHQVMHMGSADVVTLKKAAAAGAITTLVAYWKKSQSPSASIPQPPQPSQPSGN